MRSASSWYCGSGNEVRQSPAAPPATVASYPQAPLALAARVDQLGRRINAATKRQTALDPDEERNEEERRDVEEVALLDPRRDG